MGDCRLQLERRDLAVMAALEFWGVLGIGQLEGLVFKKEAPHEERARLFFNEYSRDAYDDYPCRRLLRLEREGYLKAHSYLNFPKLYTLTEKGHEELKRWGEARLPGYRGSIGEAFVRHEITVGAVGLVMKELLGLDVRMERERFTWNGPVPTRLSVSDLWIADPAQPKAVEIELSQKSFRRYQLIWEAYRRRLRPAGVVLYLTSWPSGVACLLGHAKRFEADHVFVCHLDEFKRSKGRAPFINYGEQSIALAKEPALEAAS